jgi:hypothetical protein
MERFTEPLMAQYGVRLIIGKGGMREGSLAAFKRFGGAYLAIIGGAARSRRRGSSRSRMSTSTTSTRIAVEVPRARLRPAAGRDGQRWRQRVRNREARRAGSARTGACAISGSARRDAQRGSGPTS